MKINLRHFTDFKTCVGILLKENNRKSQSLTPSNHTEPVDHGGVGVGAHHTVGVELVVGVKHDPPEVLQVHLVHDA